MWWRCFKPSNIVDPCDDGDEEEEQLVEAVKQSLREEEKRKQREDEQVKNDEQLASVIQESWNLQESPPRSQEEKTRSTIELESPLVYDDNDAQIAKAVKQSLKQREDEQLAEAVEKSLEDKVKRKQPEDEKCSEMSICGFCNFEIEQERSVNISGVLWHPECLLCDGCDKSIAIHQAENHVSNSKGKFHKSCYDRYCYVCEEKKMRKFYQHPFWEERYCRSHESDGTPKCCSCERLEPRGTNYVMLDDRRWLCLECMESAVMDSHECQHLHFEIREYFEGLNMKIEKEFPFLLVEKQALNKAEKEENIDYQYQVVTRGICLSEAQTVMSVSKATRTGLNIDTDKEPQRVVSDCEVTAILILYGLPRLLTGYILAHEMMHAYLRLNGHRKLNEVNEEGICQVLGHMWLESQTYATNDAEASSSSLAPAAAGASASKKGEWSDFEKKLVEFFKNQIETDESPVYGNGFRKVNEMVTNSSLKDTLKEILRLG